MWLKEQLVGHGRVPDGGYSFPDGSSILFQGAVSEEVHEGPVGFELGITGGTGRYAFASGTIFVNAPSPIVVSGDMTPTPARVSNVLICTNKKNG